MDHDNADETLMLRYADGDAQAFEWLYARHKGALYRYLLRQCGNAASAEELFQDIWLKLIKARHSYQVSAKFTTFLYHMAHNRLIDYYRSQARGIPASFEDDNTPDLEQLPAAAYQQPEQQEDRRRQVEQLLNQLMQLPEAQREAFLLRQEAGMSLDEIAQATGVSRETAKSRLRYAVAKLRQSLRVAA